MVIFLGLLNRKFTEQAVSYGDGERETLTLKFTIPISHEENCRNSNSSKAYSKRLQLLNI
jgi:hypothetical protein